MSDEKELFKVKWFKNQNSLSEIYQQTGMVFSFVSSPKKGSEACHTWAKCRDFLHDAVRSQITGKACSIYSFRFDPKVNPPVDLKRMRMLVSKPGLSKTGITTFKDMMVSALELLNHFERQAKSSLSRLQEVDPTDSGKECVVMFVGPGMWVQSPFMVSLYTYLIRLGDKQIKFKGAQDLQKKFQEVLENFKKNNKSDNDVSYLTELWNKLHIIVKNRKTLFPMKNGVHSIFLDDHGVNTFHNQGGIYSLSRRQSPDSGLNTMVGDLFKKELSK